MKPRPRASSVRSKVLFTIAGGAVLIHPAFAQTQATEEVEEIVVTGLRGSLKASMDIKRDAVGVVDAISAEDIGKFPDTNLAESLQRVTGISIDRRGGEGAEVTARGFGAQFNMVTLNGRAMPAADAFADFGGTSRSFNFANLASEAISGLEVYKTGRASVTPGGIGATINIRTARPFDNDGFIANVGVKALHDSTNRVGDDVTPEVSGIFSFTNDDKTWGVGLNGSYSKRDSGSVGATVFDWNVRRWTDDLEAISSGGTPLSRDAGGNINAVIVNAPEEGSLFAIPSDTRYFFTDTERERVNGQLTVQFAPTDALTLTTDFTYAENHIEEARGEQTVWMAAQRFNRIEFDSSDVVATPILLQEYQGPRKDFSFAQQARDQTNELESLGFNADWQVTESFSLALDVHDSQMSSRPTEPATGAGQVTVHLGGRVDETCAAPPNDTLCTNAFVQTFMMTNGLPIAARTLFAEPTSPTSFPSSGGNSQYAFTSSDLGTQYLQIASRKQVTDLTQARLDGDLEFDNGRIQFGVETRALEMAQQENFGQMTLGDWGIANNGEFPDGLLTPFSLVNEFEDFATAGAPVAGWKGDAIAIGQWAMGPYGNWDQPSMQDDVLAANPLPNQDHILEEDTSALYFQFGLDTELGSMPTHLLFGVRYEDTEVTSTSFQTVPAGIRWLGNNDFTNIDGTERETLREVHDYDHILPSFDFDIELRDGLKARFSASKTIARAQYDQLRASRSNGGPQGASTNPAVVAGANVNNPGLVPLESDNLDLSLEWYFGDSSYVSVGFFDKRVDNFIGTEIVEENVFGIRDQTIGPRAQAAIAELDARGVPVNDTTLFTMIALMENDPAGAAAFNNTQAQFDQVEAMYNIDPRADDPLYIFNVSKPVNNRSANIYGAEIAGQHFFGDTGFGIAANYTIVNGDVGFDNAADPSITQFALLGLSDSANLILMYENYGITARLAYNWRDTYLRGAARGNSRSPEYVEDYRQLDLSVGYDFNEQLSLSFEGINLTGEDTRVHARTSRQLWELFDTGPRYALGARYKF